MCAELFELERPYKATLSHYDHSTLTKLTKLLNAHNFHNIFAPKMYEDDIRMILTNPENKSKPVTRISQWYYECSGIKLPPELKTAIGNLLGGIKLQKTACSLVFTKGVAGSPDDYYHSGSCWWTCYNMSRTVLAASQGGAIRAYSDTGDLLGRVWYVPYKEGMFDGVVLFNAYGKDELQHIQTWGKLVAKALNTDWIGVEWNGDDIPDWFYINSNYNIFVGRYSDELMVPCVSPSLVYPVDSYYEAWYHCNECDAVFPQNQLTFINSEYYCNTCRDENCVCFEGEWMFKDDVIYVDGLPYSKYSDKIKWCYYGQKFALTENTVRDYYGYFHIKNSDTYFTCNCCNNIYPLQDKVISDGITVKRGHLDHWKIMREMRLR